MTLGNAQLICPIVLKSYKHLYSGSILKEGRVGNKDKPTNF